MQNHVQVMTISALASVAGVTTPTIRYYEDIGLLPKPRRSASGQRRYGPSDVDRLTFIRRCRDFGFPIDKVRLLASLSTSPDADCTDARDIAAGHLGDVRSRIADLRMFEATLQGFVDSCDAVCCGGAALDCVVFHGLKGPVPSAALKIPDANR